MMFQIYDSASSGKSTAIELAAARQCRNNLRDHATNQRRRPIGGLSLSVRLRWTSQQVSQALRHSDINHVITARVYSSSFRKKGRGGVRSR